MFQKIEIYLSNHYPQGNIFKKPHIHLKFKKFQYKNIRNNKKTK
jgi:hypothetical protein